MTQRQKTRLFMELPMYDEHIPLGIFSLSKLIRVMRLSRGFTQKRLAERLGTKRQHVQKWEYGLIKPRPERMQEILSILHYGTIKEVIQNYYR
jgi:transcriptional regulator with XRE-family HTH domain